MSRTYRRRKHYVYDKAWVHREWEYVGNAFIPVVKLDTFEKDKAKYHSDAQRTMWQVPKWFKDIACRRPFRRREKQALIKQLKYLDEDITFPVPKKTALWEWW